MLIVPRVVQLLALLFDHDESRAGSETSLSGSQSVFPGRALDQHRQDHLGKANSQPPPRPMEAESWAGGAGG